MNMDLVKVIIASSPAWITLVGISLTKLPFELSKLKKEDAKLDLELIKLKNDIEEQYYKISKRE